jgi:hypothetical protein
MKIMWVKSGDYGDGRLRGLYVQIARRFVFFIREPRLGIKAGTVQ